MRSQLTSVDSILSFETDLDSKTATITFDPALDINATLDALSEKSSRLEDWSIQ